MELKLKKHVHWLMCQLETNDLSLRHLFYTLNRKTTGPKDFICDIGKFLDRCENFDVVNFNLVLFD